MLPAKAYNSRYYRAGQSARFPLVALPAHPIAKKAKCTCSVTRRFSCCGEIVIFDGVGTTRGSGIRDGFCTKEQHRRFLQLCPNLRSTLWTLESFSFKYWMEVGQKEQQRRFEARIKDPLRHGSSAQWTWSRFDAVRILPSRDKCWRQPTASTHPGTSFARTTKESALNCITHLLA